MKQSFRFGIDVLCDEHAGWLRGLRVGLVAHAASVSASGVPSPDFLRQRGVDVTCLFGPEHGFLSCGGAGEAMSHGKHPRLGIPVYSLYGETRKPTAKMLKNIDVIVFDLHDLGARPYTYVSTLRLVLEAATECRKRVIVSDRPSPLANTVDGPTLNPDFESFVGFVRTPVVYGMTPGEMALWLKNDLELNVNLRVAPMAGWQRGSPPKQKWIPPSPAIATWECGLCFPITVFLEALPALDHGRGTGTPFQLVGAPWVDARKLAREMTRRKLPGVRFTDCSYRAMTGNYRGQTVNGLKIQVLDASKYLPVQTGIAIIHAVQQLHGAGQLWSHAGTREDFFDKLMGTDSVRRALQSGKDISRWSKAPSGFRKDRRSVLLYEP
jgi:uncharacterized protein YbbC (DUF1343 family)